MRQQALLLLAAIMVLFANLGGGALWDEDEPRNAGCAYEMQQRGDWIVPTFNEELRTHKPILLYWGMLTAYHVLGVSELSARLASALMAVISVLATYRLGRLLFGHETGFWSALVLASSLLFAVLGRAATPDAGLIAATTLTLLSFASGVAARHGGRLPCAGTPLAEYRISLPYALGMYAALGMAALAKGPVGLVLPIAGLVCFLVSVDRAAQPVGGPRLPWHQSLLSFLAPGRWLRAAWTLRPALGLGVLSAVALPWYVAVAWQTHGDWVAGFLGEHNLGRYLRAMENHRGPIVYYVPAILAGMFPWSVFLPAALYRAWQAGRETAALRPQLVLCGCWAGVWVACFSLAATKLPNYVAPAYPALALLTGHFLVDWRHAPAGSRLLLVRLALWTLAVVGLALVAAAWIAGKPVLGNDWAVALVGLALPAGAAWALWRLHQGRRDGVLSAVGVASISFVVLALGMAAPWISRHQDGPWLAAQVRQLRGEKAPLATYDCFASTLVYYNRGPVEKLEAGQVAGFLRHEPALLVTRSDRLEQLSDVLPPDVTVLARKPGFFRKHELVLLGRADAVQTASTRSLTQRKPR